MSTNLLEWRDEFRIGIQEVDYEHQTLIAAINALHEPVTERSQPNAVAAFLGELHGLISAHFALEEKVMRASKYARYAEHKRDHERLLDEIREIMDAYEVRHHLRIDELRDALNVWFGHHFRTHDAALHAARRSEAEPRAAPPE